MGRLLRRHGHSEIGARTWNASETLKEIEMCSQLPNCVCDAEEKRPTIEWLDPTPEMLADDPLFDAIWKTIKSWDVNVPEVYTGYMGTTGNHARAIYDAVKGAV
jgi:hypothetical protein